MARYGDIVEVLKIEIKLVRGAKAPVKSGLVLPLIHSAMKRTDSRNALGAAQTVAALSVLADVTPRQPEAGSALLGDTCDLIELLGDEREFGDVVALCAQAVAKQLESRGRAD